MLKHGFIAITFAILSGGCSPAANELSSASNGEIICTFPQHPPSFPGGEMALMKFLRKIRYPKDQATAQGRVRVTFKIDSKGALSDIKIVQKEVRDYTLLDKEVIRVVRMMPKWIPAEQDGIKVSTYFTMPICILPAFD
ncbi:energy transducer TonB [Chitinophaga caeni]|uniref:Energy transducer TonB n=1 Tax=Chitinophaga caeni TaxID=2029983 RepID=A0A291QQY2_9BACT|nr:TonB family protein [Chitinophaga caeni]ATL46419.1 energy transducer TonB [Chitinophaga caeni]